MKTTILLPVISLFLFLASCTNPSDKKVNDQTSESSESGVTSTDWQSRYDKLEASDLPDNVIQLIGKEWMLVTAGDESSFNTMTASWGGAAVGAALGILFAPEKGEDTRHKIAEILRKKGIKLNRSEMENLVDEIAAEMKGEIAE